MARKRSPFDPQKRYSVGSYSIGIANLVFTEHPNGKWSAVDCQRILDEYTECYPEFSAFSVNAEGTIVVWDIDWPEIREHLEPTEIVLQSVARNYRRIWSVKKS